MKRLFSVIALALAVLFAAAQSTAQLGLDKAVRKGTLPNGLTYYIQHNEEPKDMAYFYIAQKVGAIQEEADQRGLAHFLEHMCFNGTTHFPGTSLRAYLEKIGVKFGADLNAYTAVDETVYNIDNVPVKTPGAIDSCLWILHDWSNDLTLDAQEIDNERGVINEEWRMRNSASQRMNTQQMPVLMAGSKYEDCMPIGSMDVVMNFKPQTLRDYYEKWYRPDLQAVIVVGDVDVNEIEKKIKAIFADIPAPGKDAAVREYYPVPDNKEPIIFVGMDKEFTSPMMTIYFKHDATPREANNTEKALWDAIMDSRIDDIFHSRTTEITQTANAPFDWCTAKNGSYFLAQTKEAFRMNISTKSGEKVLERGLRAALDELNRLRQYGITEEEWTRAKADLTTSVETMYARRNKRQSSALVNGYVRNFLDNNPALSVEELCDIYRRAIATLTVDDLNRRLRSYFKDNDENIAISYSGGDNDTIFVPTKEWLWNIYTEQKTKKLEPYVDAMAGAKLLPEEPVPGTIVKREVLEDESEKGKAKGEKKKGKGKQPKTPKSKPQTIKLTLSNGATVILKPTDYRKDQIAMSALCRGGLSLFPEEMYKYGSLLNTSLGVMGLGNLSWSKLRKYLAGVDASVSAGLADNLASVQGSCGKKFVGSLLEQTHAAFRYPNNDPQAFAALVKKLSDGKRNSEGQPGVAYGQAVNFALYGNNGYTTDLTATETETADYGKLLELYKEAYSDASGFTFFFIGDIDEKEMTPYIEKYLASLPSTYSNKGCKPVKTRRKGYYQNYFEHKQETPTARVTMVYTAKTDYTLKNYLMSSILGQIMTIVYTKTIREEAGAAYSVGCGGDTHMYPENYSQLQVRFSTQPEKKDLAVGLVKSGLEDVIKNGPKQEDLDKVKEYLKKVLDGNREVDRYWTHIFQQEWFTGLNLDKGYEDTLAEITTDDIAAFAAELLKQGNYIEVIMSSPKE